MKGSIIAELTKEIAVSPSLMSVLLYTVAFTSWSTIFLAKGCMRVLKLVEPTEPLSSTRKWMSTAVLVVIEPPVTVHCMGTLQPVLEVGLFAPEVTATLPHVP
jgi:hypothetical protein